MRPDDANRFDSSPLAGRTARLLAVSLVFSFAPAFGSSTTTATLLSNYAVTVEYTDGHGTADGIVLPLTTVPAGDTAAFRFRDPRDTEVLVRVLDGCSVNGQYWVFTASLTELAYTVRIEQSPGGAVQTYTNPAGSRSGFFDTSAFACPPRGVEASVIDLAAGTAPRSDFGLEAPVNRGFFCFPDTDTACLFGTNFPVEVAWTADPASGDAQAHDPNPSERTALFGLYSNDTADVAVKMIDNCSHYEVHWAQLGNTTVDVSVVSYISGATWNSGDTTLNGVDREAFVIEADCIFTASFELGGPWEWSSSTP